MRSIEKRSAALAERSRMWMIGGRLARSVAAWWPASAKRLLTSVKAPPPLWTTMPPWRTFANMARASIGAMPGRLSRRNGRPRGRTKQSPRSSTTGSATFSTASQQRPVTTAPHLMVGPWSGNWTDQSPAASKPADM